MHELNLKVHVHAARIYVHTCNGRTYNKYIHISEISAIQLTSVGFTHALLNYVIHCTCMLLYLGT